MILAVDLGTTNRKAAVYSDDGVRLGFSTADTSVIYDNGYPCYSAKLLPAELEALICGIDASLRESITLIAVTGMAEAGLITDIDTFKPLSDIWPWFDKRAVPLFERTRGDSRFSGRHASTGLPDGSKYGIYKFLTLLESGCYQVSRAVWTGLQSYVAALLTGERCDDISVAARTDCIQISDLDWDTGFLDSLGLSRGNFPRLIKQGETAGYLQNDFCGIPKGTPVCLCGHDHVCAAYGAGALENNELFLSAGTAQVLITGADRIETESGLSYGPSPCGKPYTVLGSIQSAGGSINYFRNLLYRNESYDVLISEAETQPAGDEVIYLPYLAGKGAPHLDPSARAALSGLTDRTTRADIIRGVYTGIALETRCLSEAMSWTDSKRITCMGGLTRHARYMQTLADALNSDVVIPAETEGTLYGAARLAAARNNIKDFPVAAPAGIYHPDKTAHERITHIYENSYLRLMDIL